MLTSSLNFFKKKLFTLSYRTISCVFTNTRVLSLQLEFIWFHTLLVLSRSGKNERIYPKSEQVFTKEKSWVIIVVRSRVCTQFFQKSVKQCFTVLPSFTTHWRKKKEKIPYIRGARDIFQHPRERNYESRCGTWEKRTLTRASFPHPRCIFEKLWLKSTKRLIFLLYRSKITHFFKYGRGRAHKSRPTFGEIRGKKGTVKYTQGDWVLENYETSCENLFEHGTAARLRNANMAIKQRQAKNTISQCEFLCNAADDPPLTRDSMDLLEKDFRQSHAFATAMVLSRWDFVKVFISVVGHG